MVKIKLVVRVAEDGGRALFRGATPIVYTGASSDLEKIAPETAVDAACAYVVGKGLQAVALHIGGSPDVSDLSLTQLEAIKASGSRLSAPLQLQAMMLLLAEGERGAARAAFAALLDAVPEAGMNAEALLRGQEAWTKFAEAERVLEVPTLLDWWDKWSKIWMSRDPVPWPWQIDLAHWTSGLLLRAAKDVSHPSTDPPSARALLVQELEKRGALGTLSDAEKTALRELTEAIQAEDEQRLDLERILTSHREVSEKWERLEASAPSPLDAIESIFDVVIPPALRPLCASFLAKMDPLADVEFMSMPRYLAEIGSYLQTRATALVERPTLLPFAFQNSSAHLFALDLANPRNAPGSNDLPVRTFDLSTLPYVLRGHRLARNRVSPSMLGLAEVCENEVTTAAAWHERMSRTPEALTGKASKKLKKVDETRLASIGKGLREAARNGDLQLGDPLSSEDVKNFEERARTRLPEPFRTFLMRVANGIVPRASSEFAALELWPLHHSLRLGVPFRLVNSGSFRWGGHLPIHDEWTLVVNGKKAGSIWYCSQDQFSLLARGEPEADFLAFVEKKGALEFTDTGDPGEDAED